MCLPPPFSLCFSRYVTLGTANAAVRFVLDSDIVNRPLFDSIIRGVLPEQAGPKVPDPSHPRVLC